MYWNKSPKKLRDFNRRSDIISESVFLLHAGSQRKRSVQPVIAMGKISCAFVIAVCGCHLVACGQYAFHEARHTSERRWCLVRECGKGEEAVWCSPGSPDSTRCVPCDPDAFYMNHSSRSTDWRQCYNKRVCTLKNGMAIWNNNDNTKNRQCVCDTRNGYYAKHFDPVDPDYSADECFYCTEENEYVDTIKGCTECHGRIYTDNHSYKHCNPNTTTPDVVANIDVDTVAGESDFDESGQIDNPSGGATWYYWGLSLLCVSVVLSAGTITLCIFVRRRNRKKEMSGDRANTNNNGSHEMSAAEPLTVQGESAVDIEVIGQATTLLLQSEDPNSGSYNFVSDAPDQEQQRNPGDDDAVRNNSADTSNVESAGDDRRGDVFHIENYFAGNAIQVNGNQNGLVANGNIANSPLNYSPSNGNVAHSSSSDPPVEHDDSFDSDDSAYTVHEASDVHGPLQEVGDGASRGHNPPAGLTSENSNTSLKRL